MDSDRSGQAGGGGEPLTRPALQFGRVPYGVVDSGAVAQMTPSEKGVYIVLAGHVNGASWTATLGKARIAHLAGVDPRTADRAIAGLAAKGLIGVQGGGGRGRVNTYTLETTPETKPRHNSAGLSGEKPRHGDPKTPAGRSRNPGKTRPKPRHSYAAPTEEQREQQQQRGLAAAGDAPKGPKKEPKQPADPAVVEALTKARIANPTKAELAGTPGVTAELVEQLREETDRRGKGIGALVQNIRAAAAANVARAEDDQQTKAREVDAQRQAEAKAKAEAREQAAGRAWLAGLSDDEVLKFWRRFLRHPSTPARYKAMWTKADLLSVANIRDMFGDELAALFAPKKLPAAATV